MPQFWEDGPFECTTCRQHRMGRFCNIIAVGSGWTQHRTHVRFYCWICHPYGTAVRPKEADPELMPPSARAALERTA